MPDEGFYKTILFRRDVDRARAFRRPSRIADRTPTDAVEFHRRPDDLESRSVGRVVQPR